MAGKKRKRASGTKATKEESNAVVTRRDSLRNAPTIGNHVTFLFIGNQLDLVIVHTELFPPQTKTHIENLVAGQPFYHLVDEDTNCWKSYRSFLYTGRLFTAGMKENGADTEWTFLANNYLLAIDFLDEKFANACIDAVIEKVLATEIYPTGLANEVYPFTSEGDALRTLIVDFHVWMGKGSGLRRHHDDADGPKEFLSNVISLMAKVGAKLHESDVMLPWEDKVKACRKYHTHHATTRCF